ncbi:MAG: Planctomycete cytochrome [Chthoniobacteraceae bacterium]|nr:Planctomycete cytochrome [Chthoniobacteraceae bacterium]
MPAFAADAPPDFNKEVRPILSQNCFKCHGPDDKSRKGKLRLDLREAALKAGKSGEIAVVPGKPESSEMLTRVFSSDEDEIMPPPGAKKALTEAQKEILKRWVAAGAEYVPHWAFVPPRQAAPPAAPGSRIQNPIDAFVGAKLQKTGLKQSPTADPYTLVRRISLDLIGLPPTQQETDAFVQASLRDPQAATEALVDRLLGSPFYGERWARKWLDLARYADTNGYEKDRPRSIWPYRDWVIGALNADMPFDQFTIEQIAGDMLPNATPSQIVATGFHRNTMLNEEGGIDPLEFRFNAVTDRVATTAKTWLGLTVQCAQCHTHKYDPITHHEYYQLMAFLNNADEPDYEIEPADHVARRNEAEAKIARITADLPNRFKISSSSWSAPAAATVLAASGQKAEPLADGSWLFPEQSAETDTYTVTLETDLATVDSIRLEALPDPKITRGGPGRAESGNFVLSKISIAAAAKRSDSPPQPVRISNATADFSQANYDVKDALDENPRSGWGVAGPGKSDVARSATFAFEKPVTFAGGTRLRVTLNQDYGQRHTLGRFRISLGGAPVDAKQLRRSEALEKALASWIERESSEAVRWSIQKPITAKSNLPLLTVLDDASVLASGDQTKADTYTVTFRPGLRGITALRLEALPDASLPAHGPGRTFYEGPKGDFNLSNFSAKLDGKPLKFSSASHSFAAKNMPASDAIDANLQTGWSTDGAQGEANSAVFNLSEPLAEDGELTVELHFERHYAASLGHFRIAFTTDSRPIKAKAIPQEIQEILMAAAPTRTETQNARLRAYFLSIAPELAEAQAEIAAIKKGLVADTKTLVMKERPASNPRPTFVHQRGEFLQETDLVTPGVLAVLNPLPQGVTPNRLEFARWLVSRENPLTARVTVNRQWAAFFGRGLVRTADDFGFQGDAPSDPALLDWLAIEFINQGWSLKKLHKLIVTSATYQQSSRGTPELFERDPANILLARGPRFRLDAEIIRDSILSASSLLTVKLGGPSVYPPQPPGAQETAYGGSSWTASTGPDRYRRGLYTFAKRSAPYAMSSNFDAPNGDVCIAQREVSNTPLQALAMLNDTVIIEAAQALGSVIAALPCSDETKIETLVRRCLTRPPSVEEKAMLLGFYNDQKKRCLNKELDPALLAGKGEGDVNDRAAWTAVARAVFNLDEALTKS